MFTCAPATCTDVTAANLEALIRAHEDEAFSGLIELGDASGARFRLLFLDGLNVDSYVRAALAWKRVPSPDFSALTPSGAFRVRAVPLPIEGVRVAKALLEWSVPVEQVQADGDVQQYVQTWSARPVTSVVHARWGDTEGYVLLAGGSLPTGALLIYDGQLVDGPAGLRSLYAYSGGACTLSRHEAAASPAQREEVFALRTAFLLLADHVVSRYDGLVGKSLGAALLLDVNSAAAINGWNVRLTENGVMDTHRFESPDSAARAYRLLLAATIEHMTDVIGGRLAHTLVSEAARRIDPGLRRMLLEQAPE